MNRLWAWALSSPLLTAILVMGLVSVLVFVAQAPRHNCEFAREQFVSRFQSDLYGKPQKTLMLPSRLKDGIKNCYQFNDPGACSSAFQVMDRLTQELQNLEGQQCVVYVVEKELVIGSALNAGLTLMVDIAATARTESEIVEEEDGLVRWSWFETADLARFCRLKKSYQKLMGPEAYRSWLQASKQLESLKNKKRSLMDLNCERF